jgi:hypothetical protein
MYLLPPLVARGVSVLICAVAILLVVLHTSLVTQAASRSTLSSRARLLLPASVATFLAVWLGLGLVTGDAANFPMADIRLRLPMLAIVAFGPMLVAVAAFFASKTLQSVNAAMPAHWLVWAQTYRVLGLMFLFPFLYYGVLPAGFALPAALGDLATGLAAPWVASSIMRRRPGALLLGTAWNVFGILDLIVAPASAVMSHAPVRDLYPLLLVPLFVGPPLGILIHIFSLRNLTTTFRNADVAAAKPLSAHASAA